MLRRVLITAVTALLSIAVPQLAIPSVAHAATTTHVYPGQSLQTVVNAASPGDTIVVHEGSYPGVSINARNWAPAVTVTAAAGDSPTVASFWMLDTTGVAVEGLDITNKFEARRSSDVEVRDCHVGLGVYVRDGMQNVRVLRNRIDGGQFGVWVYNSATSTRNREIVISGNDVSGQSSDNMQIGAADDLVIEDNLIHDAVDNADHNDGIQLMGSEGAIIRRNRFWNHDQAILLKAEPYLGAGNRVAGVRVENNLIHGERGAGIIVAGAVDAHLVNNTVWGNRYADVHIEAANPGLRIWNNVLRQIWKGGTTAPAFENFNCGIDIAARGIDDVVATPAFDAQYRQLEDSPCLRYGLATGAPTDDIAKQQRLGGVTLGAWQTSAPAPEPAPLLAATPAPVPSPTPAPGPQTQGYWIARTDAQVRAFGNATGVQSDGLGLNAPIVGMAATPDGKGFWLVGRDGGVFSYGDAQFLGSTGSIPLNAPIVGMASVRNGTGYWFVASDGGVFAYGDAQFHGSMGGTRLNQPIVGMAPTPSGQGYWLVAADGGIFAFGDAAYRGSTGNLRLNKPIVAMTPTADGQGYWFTATDGGVFAFGNARFYGSTGGMPLSQPITSMATTSTGQGYWLVAADGGIFAFGDAAYCGSIAAKNGAATVAIASSF